MAPFTPFLADELYAGLTDAGSVHLSDWPSSKGRHDTDLADQMASARRLVALGRAARTEAKAKVRQPLPRALLLHPGTELGTEIEGEIRSELNVKALERIDTLSGLMSWSILPNFRVLGPRLGPKVNAVKAALAEADGSALQAELERTGWVEIAGERLMADEVEVRADRHESLALIEDDGWAVALDLELDDDLRAEGLARELIRALNDVRKQVGLAISDRIVVTLATDAELAAVVTTHHLDIGTEVLAVDIELVDAPQDDDWSQIEVGGHRVGVSMDSRRASARTERQRPPRPGSSSNSASKKAFIAASASSSGGPNGDSSPAAIV